LAQTSVGLRLLTTSIDKRRLDALVAFNQVDFPPPVIPEPETYAMLLAGLAALAGVARRRKEKAGVA
jgi:hypothetical protein